MIGEYSHEICEIKRIVSNDIYATKKSCKIYLRRCLFKYVDKLLQLGYTLEVWQIRKVGDLDMKVTSGSYYECLSEANNMILHSNEQGDYVWFEMTKHNLSRTEDKVVRNMIKKIPIYNHK